MPLQIDADTLVSFAQLAEALPPRRQNRPVHVSTIHRWRRPGIQGVRLEAIRVGGAWHTTWDAFARFCEQLTALETEEQVSGVTTAGRIASQTKADEELARDGW